MKRQEELRTYLQVERVTRAPDKPNYLYSALVFSSQLLMADVRI